MDQGRVGNLRGLVKHGAIDQVTAYKIAGMCT
jgi:hypothetical protein